MTARPATICRELLAALEASEGRRRRRKARHDARRDRARHQARAARGRRRDDPPPAAFEAGCSSAVSPPAARPGPRARWPLEVLAEWRLASSLPEFGAWLDRGAPSDDGLIVGGPDMAPHTPKRSGHPGEPGAPLDPRGAPLDTRD